MMVFDNVAIASNTYIASPHTPYEYIQQPENLWLTVLRATNQPKSLNTQFLLGVLVSETGKFLVSPLAVTRLEAAPVAKLDAPRIDASWKKFVFDPKARTDVDAISETVSDLVDALDSTGLESLDLSGLNPAAVSGEHLAAVLRITYAGRAKVKGWGDAVRVAREALQSEGLDYKDVLHGLI